MLWYISFAVPNKFLGACYVEGEDEGAAIARTKELGINPGGQAMLIPVPPHMSSVSSLPLNRLISFNELKEGGIERYRAMSDHKRSQIDRIASIVCEDCNHDHHSGHH